MVAKGDLSGADYGSNESYDIEAAIAELVSDPKRESLELPCFLNAEQRELVKKVAAQYPDLKCESFGFGKDRQLHCFKRHSGENTLRADQMLAPSPQNVNVKNTFIDDWVNADGMPADARVVQSMPHNMFGQCLSSELSAQAQLAMGRNYASDVSTKPSETVARKLHWAEEPLEQEYLIELGTEVVIDGLVKAPSFNGTRGTVQSWDGESSRYNVFLAYPAANGQRLAKIKGENLRPARP
jgi:hypothetical protein